jgi:hypothetical protein
VILHGDSKEGGHAALLESALSPASPLSMWKLFRDKRTTSLIDTKRVLLATNII